MPGIQVLLLDEATASVDPETDQLIQAALQTSFATATLFTVAHRLNTVANYDRIMVMDAGEVRRLLRVVPGERASKCRAVSADQLKFKQIYQIDR